MTTRTLVFVAAAFGVAGVVARVRSAPRWLKDRVAVAGALLGMLLLPGISWSHYYVFLVPAALVAARAARADGWRPWPVSAVLALIALLVTRPVYIDQVTPGMGILDGAVLSALVVFALLVAPRGARPQDGGRFSQSTNRPVSAAGA